MNMTNEQMVENMTGNARDIANYIIESRRENRTFSRSWFEGYVCCAVYFNVITDIEHDLLFDLMNAIN
jgi:hypothetical protein